VQDPFAAPSDTPRRSQRRVWWVHDVFAPWTMKPERRVASCVYYTMRKHDKITRMMAVFLGISTVAGILLGVLFSVCYTHCKESQARVEAKLAAVPYDHIAARARRADEKRRAAGLRTFAPRSGSST
jgi:hypothetical protein